MLFVLSIELLSLLRLLLLLSRSISDRVLTVCDDKSVQSSINVEFKSVSVVSFKFQSIGSECIIIPMFETVGDASRDVLYFR